MAARFPLYKGATRVATVLGVPLIPLIVMVMIVGNAAMLLGLWWFLLTIPAWSLMALVTRSDERAFRILGLWAQTKLANRLWLGRPGRIGVGNGDFWGASTYSLTDGRCRAWEREDA